MVASRRKSEGRWRGSASETLAAARVALTGTDLYSDARNGADVTRSLDLASRVVILQPEALTRLPERVRGKTRVIVQSAEAVPGPHPLRRRAFEVCQLAHLRPVKDPFRAAMAARLLPAESG